MLCSLKGSWCWHRNAEGAHPSSVSLPFCNFFLTSDDLFIQTIEPVAHGRFLFWVKRSIAQPFVVIGAFSGFGSRIVL
jgi:hypothetical protein